MASAHLGLASIALRQAEYDEAESLLRTALRLEDNEAEFSMLGFALRELDRDEEAKSSYLRALEIEFPSTKPTITSASWRRKPVPLMQRPSSGGRRSVLRTIRSSPRTRMWFFRWRSRRARIGALSAGSVGDLFSSDIRRYRLKGPREPEGSV